MTFHYDPLTALVTLLVLPLAYLLIRWLRKLIADHLSYALAHLAWSISRRFHQAHATRISLRRYCRLQLNDVANKNLQVPGPQAVTLETDAIFVPLRFERSSGSGLGGNLHHAFELDNRVTVVGDPGSGKSSLVKQTFREACRRGEYLPKRARLPMIIELKSFTPPETVRDEQTAGEWAVKVLRERIERVKGFDMGGLFDSFLDGPGLLILLDGLDEVASDNYERTAMAIRGLDRLLAQRSEKNVVVLTMRVQFHRQVRGHFESSFPTVYRIAPFTPSDIFAFLERWPYSRSRSENVSRIYSDLTDRPTLREMCRNPLVLAMYVANDQGSDPDVQAPPDTRTSFYAQVVEELIVERRSRQLGMSARSQLREQRETILGRLALDNLCDSTQPANSPSWTTAVQIVAEVYNCPNNADAEQRLLDLERDTGIISHERDGESLRFIHLTFCEFLAAKEAAQGQADGYPQLLGHLREFQGSSQPQLRSRLNEVIPFATALLMPKANRGPAMREVAEACNQEILGRCFLETQSYGGDVWQDYLDEEQGALLETDPSDWTDDWLTRLHLFNVVLQDAERWAELSGHQITVTLDGIFADLVGEDRKRLLTLFSSYAHNDAAAALRLAEVCGVDLASEHPELVLNNCEFPPFLAVAVQRAVAEDGAAMFWRLLLAEAGLRSHFSAMILHGQEAPERLAKTLGALPRKKLWSPLPGAGVFLTRSIAGFTVPPHEASAYGAILTIAALEYDHQHDDLKALSILARVPPPGAATSKRLIRVVALLFAVMVAYLLGSALSPPTRPEWVAVIAISILVAIPVFRYPARRDHRYATLANIVPPGEYWPEVRLGGLSALLVARRLAVRNTREALGKIYLRRLNLACAELEVLRRPYDLRRRHLLTVLDDEEPEAVVTLV